MYYASISNKGTGFTNQIFALITSLILAHNRREKVVVVDEFMDDIHKTTHTPISEILNLPELNFFLKKTYDMIIIDKQNIQFEILSVRYGTDSRPEVTAPHYVDLTDFFKTMYETTHALDIPPFNTIQGDPCPGVVKQCMFKYKINGYVMEEIFHEYNHKNIRVNFQGPYVFTFGWINSWNETMFTTILENMTYHPNFVEKANMIHLPSQVNVLHLRAEEDAIAHWSKQNRMSSDDFKTYLENKYIDLIKKYISPQEHLVLVTSCSSNRVIDFLCEKEYSYTLTPKFFKEREKNAIVDLLVASKCNGTFIGNFNLKNKNGSSFSYYIGKQLNDVNHIYMDLDDITSPEVCSHRS